MTQKSTYLNIKQQYHKPLFLTNNYTLKFNLHYYLKLKSIFNSFFKKFNIYIDSFKYKYTHNFLYIQFNLFISYLFYSKIIKFKKNKVFLYKKKTNISKNKIKNKLKNISKKPYNIYNILTKQYPSILSLLMYQTNLNLKVLTQQQLNNKIITLLKSYLNKPNLNIIISYKILNHTFKWKKLKNKFFSIIKQIYRKYLYFFTKNISFILYDIFLQFFLVFNSGKYLNQLTTSLTFLLKRQLNSRKVFRILKTLLNYFKSFNKIKGLKIQLKGRIRGNRRKKKLTLQFKKSSQTNMKTNLQYEQKIIKTKYGVLGLQIWIISYNLNI